jgi:hypothetical protein
MRVGHLVRLQITTESGSGRGLHPVGATRAISAAAYRLQPTPRNLAAKVGFR